MPRHAWWNLWTAPYKKWNLQFSTFNSVRRILSLYMKRWNLNKWRAVCLKCHKRNCLNKTNLNGCLITQPEKKKSVSLSVKRVKLTVSSRRHGERRLLVEQQLSDRVPQITAAATSFSPWDDMIDMVICSQDCRLWSSLLEVWSILLSQYIQHSFDTSSFPQCCRFSHGWFYFKQ